MYNGIYYDKPKHHSDLAAVIGRAQLAGCEKLIVTGSDVAESKKALELAERYRESSSAGGDVLPVFKLTSLRPSSRTHLHDPGSAPVLLLSIHRGRHEARVLPVLHVLPGLFLGSTDSLRGLRRDGS